MRRIMLSLSILSIAAMLNGCPVTTGLPILTLSTVNLDFGSSATEMKFEVWNTGEEGSRLSWEAEDDSQWLTLSQETGESAGPNDKVEVTALVDRSKLTKATDYVGEIRIDAGRGGETVINVKATTLHPQLAVSATSHGFGTDSNTWAFQIWNSGDPGARLNWQAVGDKPWIGLDNRLGTSTGTNDKKIVNVTIDRSKLGKTLDYSGVVTVSAAGVGQIAIVLSVSKLDPKLAVSATMHQFGSTETQWAFDITNAGDNGSSFDWTASANQPWISLDKTSGTVSDIASKDTVTVTVDRAAITKASAHSGVITVYGPHGPKTINITLTKLAAAIGTNAENHDFGSAETSWGLQVFNGGDAGTILSWTASVDAAWIAIDKTSGSSASDAEREDVTVTIDRAAIPDTGEATGNVIINGGTAGTKQVGIRATKTKGAAWAVILSTEGDVGATSAAVLEDGVFAVAVAETNVLLDAEGEVMEGASSVPIPVKTSQQPDDTRAAWFANAFDGEPATASVMRALPDGGWLVAGSAGAPEEMDMGVIRTGADGSITWAARFGHDAPDWCEDIIATEDGGALIAGGTMESSTDGYDALVVKLGPGGLVPALNE